MRNKIAFPLFLLILLASCASPAPQTTAIPEPPPPPTTTVTATFTATPEPTPTMTATLDPLAGLPEAVDISEFFDIISVDPVDNFALKSGAVVNGEVLVEKSMRRLGVDQVKMPDALGAEFLIMTAWTYNITHGLIDPGTTLAEFEQMLSEVQTGKRNPQEMVVEAYFFDLANPGPGYQLTKVVFWPGEGAVLPEGVRAINKVSMMYVRGHEIDPEKVGSRGAIYLRDGVPGFIMTSESGEGFGAVINGDTLILELGQSYLSSSSNPYGRDIRVAGLPYVLSTWIKVFDGGGASVSFTDAYVDEAKRVLKKGIEIK